MAKIQEVQSINDHPATGVVRFGSDWPGIFIRGDEAIGLASEIDAAQCNDMLPCSGPGAVLLQRVIDLLMSCKVEQRG